jgi:hypothetical protein
MDRLVDDEQRRGIHNSILSSTQQGDKAHLGTFSASRGFQTLFHGTIKTRTVPLKQDEYHNGEQKLTQRHELSTSALDAHVCHCKRNQVSMTMSFANYQSAVAYFHL